MSYENVKTLEDALELLKNQDAVIATNGRYQATLEAKARRYDLLTTSEKDAVEAREAAAIAEKHAAQQKLELVEKLFDPKLSDAEIAALVKGFEVKPENGEVVAEVVAEAEGLKG